LSISSHKSSPKSSRGIQAPQRSNGKVRVAAIVEAAATVIAEQGYDGATMAEIAARSGTKIGSLYRFFPNKESLADTIVVSARDNLDAVFDTFDATVRALSIQALAGALPALLVEQVFTRPALMQLLDASGDWSVKREEFRSAALQRIAKTLMIHSPHLLQESAGDIALILVLTTKARATHQDLRESAVDEFHDMIWLYLQSRLGASLSDKKDIPS